ncbi:interferon lambda receptor 1 [Rana temporaria]|uniref:interferon lambda receptor 1 n=1 Tax=Rana temporaria TaxID=8407 RepID=UPI001AAC993A|nr:interferon lambda receptor 1 [Rana temporaria]
MRILQEWTLLVMLGILDCVADHLHKPLNITTKSRNFCLLLTWLPSPKNPPNVTYTVEHMLYLKKKRWSVVPECKGIFATECDLTCILKETYTNQHVVRVRAESVAQGTSAWASLHNISYMFTVDPSPPILHVIQEDGTLTINISIQKPPCMPNALLLMFEYLLEIKNTNNSAEKPKKIEMIERSKTIKTDGYEGDYCMVARTIYKSNRKTSGPSHPFCFTVTQKDLHHQLMPLIGLPAVVLFVVFLVGIICIKLYKKVTKPNVLDFSDKRCTVVASVIPEKSYHVTIDKNMDQTSSATFLLSGEDSNSINEYPGFGYTERKNMQGNCLGRHTLYGDSSSDDYMSSKGLPTNSSSDKSSDSSCVQTSGSNTEMILTLNKNQLHNHSEESNTNVSGNMETLVTNTITMGPLLDTLRVAHCNTFGDGLLKTLSITAATDQCLDNESFDGHLTDYEDNHEQLINDCTDCDVPEPYIGSQPLQKNWGTGYEQRGYMSR